MTTCVPTKTKAKTRTETKAENTICACLANNEKALITFVTGGYPSVNFTVSIVETMFRSGSDIVEIGIPFSDPLADGPTIQDANTQALSAGTKTSDVFEVVSRVRSDGYLAPVVLLAYVNTVYRFGVARFIDECLRTGVDGLIVPDMPVEERHLMNVGNGTCQSEQLCTIPLVPMVAPTTSEDRIEASLRGGGGFVYCVSTTGVTGTRDGFPDGVTELLSRVRTRTDLPAAVGFGIGDPATASRAAAVADAVIVGSAIVRVIADSFSQSGGEDALEAVGRLVSRFKAAVRV